MEKQRVLVIHQKETVRNGIHQILANYEFDIIYASDGLEGLAAAKYECPDLVITDVNLPILDGMSLSRMLRNDRCTKDIPVIVLNDKLDYNFLCQARNIDVKAFLLKPYLDNSLVYAVQRVLGSNIPKAKTLIPYKRALALYAPSLRTA